MAFSTGKYLQHSKLSLFLLILGVGYGFLGVSEDPWMNWEHSSIGITFILTGIMYVDGFFLKKNFVNLDISKVGLMVLAIIAIVISSGVLVSHAAYEFDPNSKFSMSIARSIRMGVLLLSVIALSWIDYSIGKNGNPEYRKLFFYSDVPVSVTIGILFAFALVQGVNSGLEPFYSGAIAFQMMMSILIWTFVSSDEIIEPVPERHLNNH